MLEYSITQKAVNIGLRNPLDINVYLAQTIGNLSEVAEQAAQKDWPRVIDTLQGAQMKIEFMLSEVRRLQEEDEITSKVYPDTITLPPFSEGENLFAPLREIYDGFDEWYRTKRTEGRSCFVVDMFLPGEETRKLGGILIYKYRVEVKAIKICTLIVDERIRGRGHAREMLDKLIQLAKQSLAISSIYTTIPKNCCARSKLEMFFKHMHFHWTGEHENELVYEHLV